MAQYQGVGYSAKAVSTIKRVTTLPRNGPSVVQHHRGFYGVAVVKGGDRNGERCGHFHQKRGAAAECAEQVAKVLIREMVAK